jgi:hypothetical protein
MGSSASATIAWGIDIACSETDEDYEESSRLTELLDELPYEWVEHTLGFTEKCPEWPVDADREKISDRESPEWLEWRRQVDAWQERKELAVPIADDRYGDCQSGYTGTVLVLKRSRTNANWGLENVDPHTLRAPNINEVAAFDKLLDKLEFKGDRRLKLVVFACYG